MPVYSVLKTQPQTSIKSENTSDFNWYERFYCFKIVGSSMFSFHWDDFVEGKMLEMREKNKLLMKKS